MSKIVAPMTNKPLVTTMVPFSRKVSPEWCFSLASLMPPMNGTIHLTKTVDKNPSPENRAISRTILLENAEATGSKFGFFLDDDVTCPSSILRSLTFAFENADDDVGIVGGIYCTKTFPAIPLVYKTLGDGPFYKWRLKEVFPVELIATGMMMIKISILKDIPKPWFKEIHHDADEAKKDGLLSQDFMGHDFSVNDDGYFCHKVREAGYKILAHGGVLGLHWDDKDQAFMLPSESYPIQTEMARRFPVPTVDGDEYVKRVMTVYKSVYGYSELIPVDLENEKIGA